MEFQITGIVREKESKRPVPGLLVRAFDMDLIYADLLGNATTKSDGTFSIGYRGKDFQELFEKHPDIYLVIYGSARDNPIYTTKQHVRFHAGRQEHFEIEIPREQLGSDAPGDGFVPSPEPGEWKELIDEYLQTHPLDFQYDPELGFAAPRLRAEFTMVRWRQVGETDWVHMQVSNRGNGISFSAYAEIYEGPIGYGHPLRDYQLCDYKTLTLHPGQRAHVKLSWTRQLAQGNLVGVCFDPLLDPRGFSIVERDHPHLARWLHPADD